MHEGTCSGKQLPGLESAASGSVSPECYASRARQCRAVGAPARARGGGATQVAPLFFKRRPLHEGRARRGHMADRHLARGGLIVDDVDATLAGDGNHAVLVSKVEPPREAHGAARCFSDGGCSRDFTPAHVQPGGGGLRRHGRVQRRARNACWLRRGRRSDAARPARAEQPQ
jgi:hypothetical protein